jgi:type II secretory pathway component PulK
VDYREAHGPFKSVGGLTNVKGIGDKKLLKIAPHLTTGSANPCNPCAGKNPCNPCASK